MKLLDFAFNETQKHDVVKLNSQQQMRILRRILSIYTGTEQIMKIFLYLQIPKIFHSAG